MSKWMFIIVAGLLLCGTVVAETQKIDDKFYGVILEPGAEITMPNKNKAMFGTRVHAVNVRTTGEKSSQWCQEGSVTEPNGNLTTVGICTVIDKDGDVVWVWVNGSGPGTKSNWGIIAGTGKYVGATGGGTSTEIVPLGDGRSFEGHSTGMIKTK